MVLTETHVGGRLPRRPVGVVMRMPQGSDLRMGAGDREFESRSTTARSL